MRRKILLSLLIFTAMLIIGKASYATVEIVPSKNGTGKDAIVNVTVSDSFILSRGMKTNTGESLKGSNVDVHLATNKDWGAVSYLSHSIYGTNKTGGNTGKTVTINGVSYYSTTTNITGVMNWGSNPNVTRVTQTAGLINSYTSGNDNVTELYNNRETKYVEYISPTNTANTKGMAMQETSGMVDEKWTGYYYTGNNNTVPISLRCRLFGGAFGNGSSNGVFYPYGDKTSGVAASFITFRPVIWN